MGTDRRLTTRVLAITLDAAIVALGIVGCVAAAANAASIAGHVRYYGNNAPVAGIDIDLIGPTPATVTTGADGSFSFGGLASGTWRVQPRAALSRAHGVSSVDAALALRHGAGASLLSSTARLACDVDADGSVGGDDAAAILQSRVGQGTLPATGLCATDWLFAPSPSPALNQTVTLPALTINSCEPGHIQYAPLAGNVTGQDFAAIVVGDCSGNWPDGSAATPTATPSPTPSPAPTATATGSCAGFGDSFEGTSLPAGWTVLSPGGMNVAVAGGALQLTPTSGGAPNLWYNADEGALVYKPLTGNFTVTTTVHARATNNSANPPPAPYRLGGLLALDPASSVGQRNWVHVAVGAGDAGTPVAVEDKTTVSGSSNFLFYSMPSANAELRITRSGSVFSLYYRQVGAMSWTLARQHTHAEMPATVWVGLMAYSASAPPNLQVTFDEITCQ